MCIILFCNVQCENGGLYNGCYGLYTGAGDAATQAGRAFHILAFLACGGAIATWALFFAKVWDEPDGYICIITLTSSSLGFMFLSACCVSGIDDFSSVIALAWVVFLFSIGPWVPALMIALGKTGMGNICVCPPPGMKKDKPSTQPPDERMASPQQQPQPPPQSQSQQPSYQPSTTQSKPIVASTVPPPSDKPRVSERTDQSKPIVGSTAPDSYGAVENLDDKKKSEQE